MLHIKQSLGEKHPHYNLGRWDQASQFFFWRCFFVVLLLRGTNHSWLGSYVFSACLIACYRTSSSRVGPVTRRSRLEKRRGEMRPSRSRLVSWLRLARRSRNEILVSSLKKNKNRRSRSRLVSSRDFRLVTGPTVKIHSLQRNERPPAPQFGPARHLGLGVVNNLEQI